MSEYRKLNFNKLKFGGTLSTDEALKDVAPIDYPDEVLNGDKKISITKVKKDYVNKCVKLEISY